MKTKKKTKKTKKHIAKIFTAVFALALILFSALPIGAISGNFYTGEGSFSINYDTTNDVIRPICENNLVFFPPNGYMNNYYTSNVIINNDSFICNNFRVENGSVSYDRPWPWTEDIDLAYPSANNLPTFNYSRGGNNTQLTYNFATADLGINGVENVGQSKYALIKINRTDDCYYKFGTPKRTDSNGNPIYDFYYPQFMSVYSKDFFLKFETIEYFKWNGGLFGYRIEQIGDDSVWKNGTYTFRMEYINIETGEEHTFEYTGSASGMRSTTQNTMRLPLIPNAVFDELIYAPTIGKANLIYVKNIYCNYNLQENWVLDDTENEDDNGTHITAFSGYVACSNKNTNGTDFNDDVDNLSNWNVTFNKEYFPEVFASRQRYLTSFAHENEGGMSSSTTYTSFMGNALRGVLEPDIFGTFGLGDVLGIVVAFAVVMGFLKFFCGG